jgi:hypothetical protein
VLARVRLTPADASGEGDHPAHHDPRYRMPRIQLSRLRNALTIQFVANQESQVPEKQQRAGCVPRSAIRLAHLPGEAGVPLAGARLLSAWHCSDALWGGRAIAFRRQIRGAPGVGPVRLLRTG